MTSSAFRTGLVLALLCGCGSSPSAPARNQGGDDQTTGGAGGDSTGGAGAGGGGAAGGAAGTGAAGSGAAGSGAAGSGGGAAGSGAAGSGAGGETGAPPDASAGDDAAPAGGQDAGASGGAGGGSVGAGGPPAACPNCKKIFDGSTLTGWQMDVAGAFAVKDNAIASTGKGANIWTTDTYGDYRIFFRVTQVKLGSHKPCTIYFGTVPASNKPARGLSGIQFQPPNGGSWDYRPGKNNAGGAEFTRPVNPMYDVTKPHQCEVLVKASAGTFRATCCEITGEGPCTGGPEVLDFKDATAGKKAPWGIMMHNDGLFDEYTDIWVDPAPTGDDLLTLKK